MKPARMASALVAAGLMAAGCGHAASTDREAAPRTTTGAQAPADGNPPAAEYAGPLEGEQAAAKALECDGEVGRASAGLHPTAGIHGASTPEGAIANWNKDAFPFSHPIAREGYELAVRRGDRALLIYTYGGRVRSAAIAVHEKDPKALFKGWAVLDAAWCDLSEFPPELDANNSAQVWSDRDGRRVSTRVLTNSAGPAHCDWDSATFLFLDNEKRWYLRDPERVLTGLAPYGTKRPAYVRGPYLGATTLPKDAVDTGYHRNDMALFLTDDAAYLQYADHVEAWPRTTEGWGCA